MSDSPVKTENAAAVLKVFAVFETLTDAKTASLSDIAQAAMTSKTTAHRLLNTLVDLGYAEQDADTEKYSLTLKLFSLAARSLSGRADLLKVADRVMGKLSRATGESINLGVMDSREQKVTYIHKFDSFYSLSMQSTLGLRNPLHSTSLGKALLAWCDAEEIGERTSAMAFDPIAPRTITDPAEFRAQLETVRQQGYAEEIEESEAGVRCMATPILDHMGKSVAAISIAFPIFRFDEAKKPEYIALLREAGQEASAALGFQGAIAGARIGDSLMDSSHKS
ncbi:IclR family transcriptional regulator domain-containing protein [Pseudoprimorskyibacter insulae]|uniref:Pectin degradation repressor protein KdgR n=1 Tax=Pseudoprimorskyibacter insulae TaxID=1695997 RepID=A0A2R8AQG8_9RHOB|nr:IclR family transcriptional regulator C-terminal domain-containing protein [Pseudoprimorskyibacter insulae]SPF78117.1 Pectin degradation repressor protein KdgR [Pseudoprimorskyibacter insulae]